MTRAGVGEVRVALEELSRVVIQESEGHTFGTPNYDMTLDHLHDMAVSARTALDGPDYEFAWRDLRERLIQARSNLEDLATDSRTAFTGRLSAKRAGVGLALSYMDEWERIHAE